MEKTDILVVGAGPAGLTAAKILGEAGKDVLVIDKLPKNKIGDKICTGALSKKSLGVVASLYPPIPDDIYDLYPGEWNAYVDVVGKRIYLGSGFGTAMIDRVKFGQWQLKIAEESGANMQFQGKAVAKKIDLQKNILTLSNGDEIKYKIVVGADGAFSTVRRTLGLPNSGLIASSYKVPVKTKTMYWFIDFKKYGFSVPFIFPHGTHAYAGMWMYSQTPVSIEMAQQRFNKTCKRKFGFDFLRSGSSRDGKRGLWLINSNYNGFKFGNIYLIGDTMGAAETNYGEGIFWALRSGELISKMICGEDVEAEWNWFMRQKMKHDAIKPLLTIYENPLIKLGATASAPLVNLALRSGFANQFAINILKEIFLEGFVYR